MFTLFSIPLVGPPLCRTSHESWELSDSDASVLSSCVQPTCVRGFKISKLLYKYLILHTKKGGKQINLPRFIFKMPIVFPTKDL